MTFAATLKLQKLVADLWTALDVAEQYNRTGMTVHLWREQGLPCVIIPGSSRDAVRFIKEDVVKWCKDHNISAAPIKRVRRPA